jgi:hypothetical protein
MEWTDSEGTKRRECSTASSFHSPVRARVRGCLQPAAFGRQAWRNGYQHLTAAAREGALEPEELGRLRRGRYLGTGEALDYGLLDEISTAR